MTDTTAKTAAEHYGDYESTAVHNAADMMWENLRSLLLPGGAGGLKDIILTLLDDEDDAALAKTDPAFRHKIVGNFLELLKQVDDHEKEDEKTEQVKPLGIKPNRFHRLS